MGAVAVSVTAQELFYDIKCSFSDFDWITNFYTVRVALRKKIFFAKVQGGRHHLAILGRVPLSRMDGPGMLTRLRHSRPPPTTGPGWSLPRIGPVR